VTSFHGLSKLIDQPSSTLFSSWLRCFGGRR